MRILLPTCERVRVAIVTSLGQWIATGDYCTMHTTLEIATKRLLSSNIN